MSNTKDEEIEELKAELRREQARANALQEQVIDLHNQVENG